MYSAPAGDRPAGADTVTPTTAILPNGRIASPAGQSVLVGTNPLAVALSPDGRFAIVSNDDARTGRLTIPNAAVPPSIGYSLAVVDTRAMTLASVYRDASPGFFMGVAAARDPDDPARTIVLASDAGQGSVRVFDLDASGQLLPEAGSITLPAAAGRRAFPAGIALADDARFAYVANNLGNAVTEIDLAKRAVARSVEVGDFPLHVAAAGGRVLVSSGGLSTYTALERPAAAPHFVVPSFDPNKSSTVTVFDLLTGADSPASPVTVPMDGAPDGSQIVGGASPGAIAVRRDGRLAYVALANVDRVAVISLTGGPRVVRGLDLRLFPNAPYGAQPSAVVLSKDEKRLYVALAGLNAVAVLDARMPSHYRYGLIPTGWYPTALAMSPNGRYLYVTSAKGVDGWGLFTRVDLKHASLVKTTLDSLRYNRTVSAAKYDAVIPPLRSGKRSAAIDHVVYVAVGPQTYDATLGDLTDSAGAALGNGNAAYTLDPERVTPNLHALARAYATADNFYASDADAPVARLFATTADASLFAQLTAAVKPVRTPFDGEGVDPEDYARAGYVFNALARASLSFRDYGGLLQLSGYDDGLYHLDVPALAALDGNVDLNYAVGDPRVDSAHRAGEFVRDMGRYVDAGQTPSFSYVWLPTPRQGGIGEADRALGTIVQFLSRTPHWSSTAVFVVPEGVNGGADHVNPMRSYCLVVSPFARRGFVGHVHLSASSVVKTEEEIFGLPPLGLGDLLASDMASFFASAPSPEPYTAIR